jgi:hypothetical protein
MGVLPELPVSLDFVRLAPDELAQRFALADPPVGVMFHHAEMDDAAMDLAGELLALLAGHSRVVARPMMASVWAPANFSLRSSAASWSMVSLPPGSAHGRVRCTCS